MSKPTVSAVLKMSKSDLEIILAKDRARQFPTLYAGHEDAIPFVRNCLGKTRRDLLLSIAVAGLVMSDHGGAPPAGWQDK